MRSIYDLQWYEDNPDAPLFLSDDSSAPSSAPSLFPVSSWRNFTWDDVKNQPPSVLSDIRFTKDLQEAYLKRVNKKNFSVIQNAVTGAFSYPLSSVRGNSAHAYRKKRRIQPIIDAYGDKEYSSEVVGSRSSELRHAHAVIITFSFTRENTTQTHTKQGFPIKAWKSWDAWESLKGEKSLLNQFKVELSRIVGSSYGSCTVKEGSQDMYPAPHMVVIFDKPILAHRWGKQWLLGRANDRSLVDRIQAIWERMSGSHCKINAVISKGGFSYVFKYITKSIDIKGSDLSAMSKDERVTLNTHLNQSLHNLNDVISPAFLRKLDYVRELNLLDSRKKELKQLIAERDKHLRDLEGYGGFNPMALSLYPYATDLLWLIRVIKEL